MGLAVVIIKNHFSSSFLFLVLTLTGCGGGGGGGGSNGGSSANSSGSGNTPPSVTVNASAVVNAGETVILSASAVDINGDTITYNWTQLSGTRVLLDDAGAAKTTFLSPASGGTLSFRVDVSDGVATSSSSEVSINVLSYSGGTTHFTQNPLVEHAEFAEANSLDVLNGYAYVAAGSDGMLVYDLSSPIPQLAGSYTPSSFNALEISVTTNRAAVYALSTPNHGIRIIDTTNPASPVYKSFILTGVLSIRDMELSSDGSTLYAATSSGLKIYDLSDPVNPVQVTLDPAFTFSDYMLSLELVETVSSKTLFVSSKSGGIGTISVFDVTDPVNSLTTTGTLTNLSIREEMTLSGTKIYAAGLNSQILNIIDISTPSTPSVIGTWNSGDWVMRDVVVKNNTAYIADWFRGVAVIDVTDPALPVLIGAYDTPGRAFDLALHNNNIVVADNEIGLQVLDVTTPSSIQPIRSFGISVSGRDVTVRNGKAFLADEGSSGQGLVAYDVSNPLNPSILGSIFAGTTSRPAAVKLQGNYALTASSNGLKIINVKQPSAMSLVGEHLLWATKYTSIELMQNYAYVGTNGSPGKLVTFDISDMTNPVLIDTDSIYEFDYYPINSVARDGTSIYLASSGGLYAADLTDPANPVMENSTNAIVSGLNCYDITAVANTAIFSQTSYLGDYFDLVDTTNLPSATTKSKFNLNANGVAVAGRYLYVSNNEEYSTPPKPSLFVYDIVDPANPSLAGFFDLPDIGRFVDVADGYAYVAMKTKGIAMMQAEPVLSTRYAETTVSNTLNYTVSWNEYSSTVDQEVKCFVTGGNCNISAIDQSARTATVSWTLPAAASDYEITVVVGDQHTFFSTKDRVTAN